MIFVLPAPFYSLHIATLSLFIANSYYFKWSFPWRILIICKVTNRIFIFKNFLGVLRCPEDKVIFHVETLKYFTHFVIKVNIRTTRIDNDWMLLNSDELFIHRLLWFFFWIDFLKYFVATPLIKIRRGARVAFGIWDWFYFLMLWSQFDSDQCRTRSMIFIFFLLHYKVHGLTKYARRDLWCWFW